MDRVDRIDRCGSMIVWPVQNALTLETVETVEAVKTVKTENPKKYFSLNDNLKAHLKRGKDLKMLLLSSALSKVSFCERKAKRAVQASSS